MNMVRQTNNHRALGDLGNLVSALSTRCTISKGRVLATTGGESFGATLAKNGLLTQAPAQEFEEHMKWGAKQRRTRERNHIKTNVENFVVPLADKAFRSVQLPSPHEVISWSRVALLKNDSESMIIDLIKENEDDDECCEIETEEAEGQMPNIDEAEGQMPNIDEAYMDNPLAVADDVQDIYSFYHEREIMSCVPPDYMSLQSDINEKMRAILVDWLIEVHLKFGFMHETLFVAINLFDSYISCQSVVRKSLQLVGVTSMLLASKYEEIYAPIVEDFFLAFDNAYRKI